MVLVDTSVWIDHLRHNNNRLGELLDAGEVLMHPFVVGELALGMLRQGTELLTLLTKMPHTPVASYDEVLSFIEIRSLAGKGIGYVEAHLLAAAVLANSTIWTLDASLNRLARVLRIA